MKSEKRRNIALTVSAIFVAALLACAAALSMAGAWGGFGVAKAEDDETNCTVDGHVLVGTYDDVDETWTYACSVCEETIELEESTPIYSVTLNVTKAADFTASAAWNEISNTEPTIVLQNDFEIHTATYFYRDATIDLNGKKLTGPSESDNVYVFRIDVNDEYGDADPTLTINDSAGGAEVDGYKLFYTMKDCTIVVNGGTYDVSEGGKIANMKSGSLYINDGEFTCEGKTNGVELYNDLYANTEGAVGAYFEMNGGSITVTGAAAALTSNNTQASGCIATINGGELISKVDTGIYWPIEGELTVNDGYIEGATGIDIKMGRLTVNGGKIVGTGELDENLNSNNSGSQNDGSAIRIDGQQYGSNSSYYINSDELVVTINGGELTSQNGHAVAIYDNEETGDEEEAVSVEITGGNFTSAEGCDSLLFKSADETEANDESREFNMSVSISGGTYDSPFHGSMLSDDIVSASYDGTVYVGTGEEVSEAITEAATEAGDENVEITIIAGSGELTFTDIDVTVSVSADYGYSNNEITVNGETVEHIHTWNDGEEITSATCTTDGEILYTCECGETKSEIIEALGHNYQLDTTAEGYVETTECGGGTNVYVCSRCQDSYSETVEGTGEHIVTEWTTTIEADCVTDGEKSGICSVCGQTITEIIPKLSENGEHTVTDWTWTDDIEANCGLSGTRTGMCDVCGAEVTETVEATGEHTYFEDPVYKDSLWYDICEVCGYEELIVDATGRTFKAQTLDELQSALDMDGATVAMQNDIVGSVTISVSVTLDLNGYTLSDAENAANGASYVGTIDVLSGGNLTVVDSSDAKSGAVDSVTDGRGALVVEAGGAAALYGGTFTRSLESEENSWYTIANAGTLTINEGTIVENGGTYYAAIVNGWTGVKASRIAYYAASDGAALEIKGGSFSGGLYTVLNEDGETVISGGDFTNGYVATIANRSRLTISGGKFANEYDGSDFDSCLILNLEGDGSDPETVISGGELNGVIIIEAGTVTLGDKVYGEEGPETLEIETDETGDQSIVGDEDEGNEPDDEDEDDGDDAAFADEPKTYEKSLAWTVGLSVAVGVVIVLGLILTAVGCDTGKKK